MKKILQDMHIQRSKLVQQIDKTPDTDTIMLQQLIRNLSELDADINTINSNFLPRVQYVSKILLKKKNKT